MAPCRVAKSTPGPTSRRGSVALGAIACLDSDLTKPGKNVPARSERSALLNTVVRGGSSPGSAAAALPASQASP